MILAGLHDRDLDEQYEQDRRNDERRHIRHCQALRDEAMGLNEYGESMRTSDEVNDETDC